MQIIYCALFLPSPGFAAPDRERGNTSMNIYWQCKCVCMYNARTRTLLKVRVGGGLHDGSAGDEGVSEGVDAQVFALVLCTLNETL